MPRRAHRPFNQLWAIFQSLTDWTFRCVCTEEAWEFPSFATSYQYSSHHQSKVPK
jgi:hypothetical protein